MKNSQACTNNLFHLSALFYKMNSVNDSSKNIGEDNEIRQLVVDLYKAKYVVIKSWANSTLTKALCDLTLDN
uniref:Uncharacterized protein n=1 Tax=Panagrolaimus sp. JU765 TaxID=591449 RepID=A0AC34QHT5_9BILA